MSLKKSLYRIHEFHDVEPTAVNKGTGWEATQHFSGKFLIRFQYLLFFSFIISHALGTMHKLSVGVQLTFNLGCLAFYLYPFLHLFYSHFIYTSKKKITERHFRVRLINIT